MSESAPALEARRLLRAARVGTLATTADGQPFASLVTPATAPDLSLLLLLSDLSEHTRHLRAEPRCSVLVTGSPEAANPQTAPRVTVTGLAECLADAGPLQPRYLAIHPVRSDCTPASATSRCGASARWAACMSAASPAPPVCAPPTWRPPRTRSLPSRRPPPESSATATPTTPMRWPPSPACPANGRWLRSMWTVATWRRASG